MIDPDVRFGDPTVDGISTEILWELAEGGEAEDTSPTSTVYRSKSVSPLPMRRRRPRRRDPAEAGSLSLCTFFDADVLGLAKLRCQNRFWTSLLTRGRPRRPYTEAAATTLLNYQTRARGARIGFR